MIAHLALFTPRADLSESEQSHLLKSYTEAVTTIPSIRSIRLGRRITHGLPGYEQMMRDHYEYLAIFEFDDAEGLKAYLMHPAHAAIGRHFTVSAVRALAYDYEWFEAAPSALP